jgi:hypothetical protein
MAKHAQHSTGTANMQHVTDSLADQLRTVYLACAVLCMHKVSMPATAGMQHAMNQRSTAALAVAVCGDHCSCSRW